MILHRLHRIIAIVIALVLFAASGAPAEACVAAFGYTGTGTDNAAFIKANVPNVGTGYLGAPADPSHSLVSEVAQIAPVTGPVFINLKELLFAPNLIHNIDCTHYERGSASESKRFYLLYGGTYEARLEEWFETNSQLFELLNGQRQVYGLVIHDEANNDCVENWVLHLAATKVQELLDEYAEYGPIYVSVGIGLRNRPGAQSNGFLLAPVGGIGKFATSIDLVGYSAYDIFDPANDSDPFNLNAETFTALSAKLDQSLHPHQKTAVIIKGFCVDYDPSNPPAGLEEV